MRAHFLVILLMALCLASSCAKTRRVAQKSFPASASIKPEIQEAKPTSESTPNNTLNVPMREERVVAFESKNDISNFRYYVIVGSFRSKDNAQTFRVSMENEGFQTAILENEAGLYRVSVGAYYREDDARSRVANIRMHYPHLNDVWLLVQIN